MDFMITIAGMQVRLKYTVNSLCAMEDLAGGALEDAFERQFTAARLLLWGGTALWALWEEEIRPFAAGLWH